MDVVVLAGATMVVYFTSFALFKIAAGRMKRLSGGRPFQLIGQVLSSRWWLLGLAMIFLGLTMEGAVLTTVPLAVAVPVFGSGLVFLLLVGIGWFGERLTAREWSAMVVTGAALVLLAMSAGLLPVPGAAADRARLAGSVWTVAAPPWKLAAVAVPSVLLPLWMFFSRDRAVDGRHARPLTGVAYGIGAGVLLGTAELAGLGAASMLRGHRPGLLTAPYPYVVLLAGGLGLGLLQVAVQRCRMCIVVTVVTIAAKLHLLLAGTLLSGQPWPHQGSLLALRTGGLLLAALAVLLFPRHEPGAPAAEPPSGVVTGAERQEGPPYSGSHRRAQGHMSTT